MLWGELRRADSAGRSQSPIPNVAYRVTEAGADTCTIRGMKAHVTHQVRAFTNARGHARLDRVLRMCTQLYNAALRDWRDAYRQAGVSRSRADQFKELTKVRRDDPSGWGGLSVQVGRGVLMRLDRARRAFYRRVELGETPGYPRFKTHSRWRTIELGEPARGMLASDCVRIKGLPTLRLRNTGRLPDPAQVRALTITKRGRRVYVNLTYEVEREPLPRSPESVGINMGTSELMALSTGEHVGSTRRDPAGLQRARRRLLRCEEGSRRWRARRAVLVNQHHRERVRSRNECHRLTSAIVMRFGLIAVGELVHCEGERQPPKEQAWSLLQSQLAYKAEWAGREFVRVDSLNTTVTCSECGVSDPDGCNRGRFECAHCGHEMAAGINSAVNILKKAMAGGTSPPTISESSELCPT